MVSGPSGSGKTVLLQSLAGLWPYASGSVRLPRRTAQEAMFVSQLPYLPLGDLRAVASLSERRAASVDDRDMQQALLKVALPHLVIRLNEVRDWGKVLSVGEQQRIAFARILLNKPQGGVPRRVDLGDGRGPRADALRADSRRAARRRFWSA